MEWIRIRREQESRKTWVSADTQTEGMEVAAHMEMPRLSQGGHKVVTRWSQGCSICHKVASNLYKIPRLSQVLSQGCHKVVKWL